MSGLPHEEIQKLIDVVRNSTESFFYKERWGNEKEFERLPAISRNDFFDIPLSQRRYKREKALVKTVRTQEGLFASEWSFADIANESYGPTGVRPLVYFADPDEAIEKAMWCYEREVLPLIGEAMPEVVRSAADFYRIDSLITDAISLEKLLPYLQERPAPLTHISVVGISFDVDALLRYIPFATDVHLVMGMPETGAFAHAHLQKEAVFTLLPDCYIQKEGALLLTKKSLLVTPIIRYALPSYATYHG